MASDDYKQFLSATRFFAAAMCLNALIVQQRAAKKKVVPGGGVQSRDFDVCKVFFDGKRFPVIVIIRMRYPIEEIWRDRFCQVLIGTKRRKIEQRIIAERQLPDSTQRIRIPLHEMNERVMRQA